jgi:REP element-mobilizing transposase RayT
MDSINYGNNKNVSDLQYNFAHLVLVSKYRFKAFKNPKMQKIVADAFREIEMKYKNKNKGIFICDDYAHVHMEVNAPNTLFIVQVIQISKSHLGFKNLRRSAKLSFDISKRAFLGKTVQ